VIQPVNVDLILSDLDFNLLFVEADWRKDICARIERKEYKRTDKGQVEGLDGVQADNGKPRRNRRGFHAQILAKLSMEAGGPG